MLTGEQNSWNKGFLIPLPSPERRNKLLGVGHLIFDAERAVQQVQDSEGNSDSGNAHKPKKQPVSHKFVTDDL
jgi:hypothetical protein